MGGPPQTRLSAPRVGLADHPVECCGQRRQILIDHEHSDVDLLVTLAPGVSGLALGGLLFDAEELLGRRVDVVTEGSLHPALRERVLADAVPL